MMSILAACVVPHPPLIVHEVGGGREREIQKTIDSYQEVMNRIAALKPETIVIMSPHSIMYQDYFHISPGKSAGGDFSGFGVKRGKWFEANYDTEFVTALSSAAIRQGIMAGTEGQRDSSLDHATLVPLYFLNQFYTDYKLVRIGLSGMSVSEHYRFGKCIAETAELLGRRTVFIASGDLSHRLTDDGPYSYAPEGGVFDKEICDIIATGDFGRLLSLDPNFCEAAGECGYRAIVTLAGALDGKAVKPELLSYEGPFGVGYAVGWFDIIGKDEHRRFDALFEKQEKTRIEEIKSGEDPYVRLARYSLEKKILTGKAAVKEDALKQDLPQEMLDEKAGVFVSLKKHGQLRGCIGTTGPITGSVAEEILRNAVSAGLEDPRFDDVRPEELPLIEYSVDVLGPSEPIDSLEDLDVVRYGVIVRSGYKKGLLLPNLEGVDTPQKQVEIALRKAGIGPGETYAMERFEVVRHK